MPSAIRLISVPIFVALLVLSIAASAADVPAKSRFDLSAQPLAKALNAFAIQAGLNIYFDPPAVVGLTAPALKAELTAQDALERLLAGTGLKAVRVNESTVRVVQKDTSATSSTTAESEVGLRLAQADSTVAPVPSNGAESAATAAEEQDKLEEIMVLGSRIEREPGKTAAPVTILDRKRIEQSGATTMYQLLNQIPQLGLNPDESGQASFDGVTPIQLRGLSLGTTLVLINGRRTAPTGLGGFGFSANILPVSVVERVEVLADGASAIYGADALAGVVNFVLRDDMEGVNTEVRYGNVTDGDAGELQSSLSAGFKRSRGSASLVLDYYDRDPLLGADRPQVANQDHTQQGGSDFRVTYFSNPGTIYAAPGAATINGLSSPIAAVPSGITGMPTVDQFVPTQGEVNLESFGQYQSFVPKTHRRSAFANGKLALTDSIELAGDVLYTTMQQDFIATPPPLVDFGLGFLQIPAANPFNPFGVDVGIDRLLTEAASVRFVSDVDSSRSTLGLRGQHGGWRWNVGALYAREDASDATVNSVDLAAVLERLANPDPAQSLNLFSERAASPQIIASLRAPPIAQRSRVEARLIDAQVTHSLFSVPGGLVRAAFGAEAHNESLEGSLVGVSNQVDRDVRSAFVELAMPLVGAPNARRGMRRLELSVAGRVDDYSDRFGTTANPKFGIEYEPVDSLAFRATYGTSFKAPTLRDLYGPREEVDSVVEDPARGDVTIATLILGGNPALDPEEGSSFNLGAVLKSARLPALQLSADAWWVREDSRISRASQQTILANEDLFIGRVTRVESCPGDPVAPPCPITRIDLSTLNFGKVDVSGLDIRGQYTWDVARVGKFVFDLAATYVSKYEATLIPGQPAEDRVARASFDGYATRWRGTATVIWSRGSFSSSLTSRYVGGYLDYNAQFPVEDQTLFDAQASFDFAGPVPWLKGMSATVGMINLLDEDPPFLNDFFGYDARQADIRGRFAYVRLGARF